MRPSLPLAALLLCLGASAFAQEAAEPRVPRLLLNSFAVVRLHPLGADVRGTVTYHSPIGDSSERMWRTRFWSVGATGTINPAEAGLQAFVEYEPLAMFQVRATAEYRGYFGTFNELLSFDQLSPVYNDQIIREAGGAGINQPTTRWTLRIDPKLRAAVGPIGIQNTFSFLYSGVNVPAGRLSYYDSPTDTLRPVNGVTLVNTLSVAYLAGPLTVGALHEWNIPWGLPPVDQVHRVGAVGSYTFYDDKLAWMNKPTVFSLVLFNVVHRGRVAHIPTFVVGFSGETDLWAKR